MKQKLYILAILVLVLSAPKSEAQHHITSVKRIDTVQDTYCDTTRFYITTDVIGCSPCSAFTIESFFGDGTNSSININDSGYAIVAHYYNFPGNYTMETLFVNDTLGGYYTFYDSTKNEVDESLFCTTLPVCVFYDSSGTGVYNSSDRLIVFPINVEISKNGMPIDTISCTSGLYYFASGVVGDIYSFKIISNPTGMVITCPSGGVIYDTIGIYTNRYNPKYFGLQCATGTSFDFAVNAVVPVAGVHDQEGNIFVSNLFPCIASDATVTINFSPKYVPSVVGPPSASVSGNTITWYLTGVTLLSSLDLPYRLAQAAGDLIIGDTVQEYFQITPIIGDLNPSNNAEIVIDTVKGGFDPNEMSVSPSGYISSGTQLQYTIGFENTGNDTAYNISVYDTLSNNVDVKSLNLIMASAVMNIATLNVGGQNIVKFDFPNINLLDSSHHGLCDGAVIFTVNSKSGLPSGTTIFNHAGIFFDYNPVVMTDTVEDIIGFPASAAAVNKTSKATIYPNPANDVLTIKIDNGAYSTMDITNTIGQLMLSQTLNNTQTQVNVKALPAGLYYITLRGESGVKVMKMEKVD